MRLALAIAATLSSVSAYALAADIPEQYGDGKTDATKVFQDAVDATPSGGRLRLRAGHYLLSGTISVSKPITIEGTGLGTQLYESADQTLLRITGVNGAVIRDIYFGSAATSQGTSLLELANSNHNRIDDVTMLGSSYGLHLKGSLLNTIIDLRSGNNFGGFFAAASDNKWWVYAERFGGYSANANTFVAPVLEGKGNGIALTDGNGQGSLTVIGGSIEGVSGTAISLTGTFDASFISGTDMEANGADVTVTASSNITLNTVYSLSPVTLTGDTRNILVSGGVVDKMTIGAATKRIRVENVTTDTTCHGGIANANTGTAADGTPNVVLSQVGDYCGGQ